MYLQGNRIGSMNFNTTAEDESISEHFVPLIETNKNYTLRDFDYDSENGFIYYVRYQDSANMVCVKPASFTEKKLHHLPFLKST